MRQRLEAALTQAGVDHRIETQPTRHGWVPRDTALYEPAATERHRQALLGLLDAKFKSTAA